MDKQKIYIQYGCGLSAPQEWVNFDASPTLRIQKIPVVGRIAKSSLNVVFPDNVRYGDIIKGLPVHDESADAVYCSHTLEHLALNELRIALGNTYRMLKYGGVFRCVVPDLQYYAQQYLKELELGIPMANYNFLGRKGEVLFGVEHRVRGVKGIISYVLGNSHHLWMWDEPSLMNELVNAGFRQIRRCRFNDSPDENFKLVESAGRFSHALALEGIK